MAYLHMSKTAGWYVAGILTDLGFATINDRLNGGHLGVADVPSNIYTFGFIRHPVAWYISLFNYLSSNDWMDNQQLRSSCINEFIEKTQYTHWNYNDLYLSFFGIGTHLQCNYIGKYESLDRDLRFILNKFKHILKVSIDDIDTVFIKHKGQIINRSTPTLDNSISDQNLWSIYINCQTIFDKYGYKLHEYK